jgi:hypothetical protein
MTWPRRVVPGTTYLLTGRCTQRRFKLVPRGVVPKLFGYCVALAAERHGILVHAVTCMSNHWHAVVTEPHGTIPTFACDVVPCHSPLGTTWRIDGALARLRLNASSQRLVGDLKLWLETSLGWGSWGLQRTLHGLSFEFFGACLVRWKADE